MTVNGKDITVSATLEGNMVRWKANSPNGLTTRDLIEIQAIAGFHMLNHGTGEMKFFNGDKDCTWSCFQLKEDYNPSRI